MDYTVIVKMVNTDEPTMKISGFKTLLEAQLAAGKMIKGKDYLTWNIEKTAEPVNTLDNGTLSEIPARACEYTVIIKNANTGEIITETEGFLSKFSAQQAASDEIRGKDYLTWSIEENREPATPEENALADDARTASPEELEAAAEIYDHRTSTIATKMNAIMKNEILCDKCIYSEKHGECKLPEGKKCDKLFSAFELKTASPTTHENRELSLKNALYRLAAAAFSRETTQGDPCTLIAVQGELRAATANARTVIKEINAMTPETAPNAENPEITPADFKSIPELRDQVETAFKHYPSFETLKEMFTDIITALETARNAWHGASEKSAEVQAALDLIYDETGGVYEEGITPAEEAARAVNTIRAARKAIKELKDERDAAAADNEKLTEQRDIARKHEGRATTAFFQIANEIVTDGHLWENSSPEKCVKEALEILHNEQEHHRKLIADKK